MMQKATARKTVVRGSLENTKPSLLRPLSHASTPIGRVKQRTSVDREINVLLDLIPQKHRRMCLILKYNGLIMVPTFMPKNKY